MGADVYLVGPLPTPGIAFLTASMRCDAGVVISGSHNAYEDNGIKFFDAQGFKLPDALELRMEDLIQKGGLDAERAFGDRVGSAHRIDEAIGRYIVFLKNTFPRDLTLEGLRIVVDCAHGAAYRVARPEARRLHPGPRRQDRGLPEGDCRQGREGGLASAGALIVWVASRLSRPSRGIVVNRCPAPSGPTSVG